jgi:hypothetical protein
VTGWDHHHDPGDAHDPTPDWAGPGPDHHLPDPAGFADHSPPDDPLPPDAPPGDPHDLPTEPAALPAEGAAFPSDGPPEPWADPAVEHEPWSAAGLDLTDAGTDPAGWADGGDPDPFPPSLELDVTPADGGPWTDPDLLGAGPADWAAAPADPPSALLPDLATADADPDATWADLQDSDDPAVRALAQHWSG